MVPLTSIIARRNGLLETLVNILCKSVVLISSAGRVTQVSQTSKIAAMSCFYLTVAYGFTSANAAAGSEAGHVEGRDNLSPRLQNHKLRGLPLRLQSAHQHMLEIFPLFAIGAALTQVMVPGDQGLINLLGLHVLTRVFL